MMSKSEMLYHYFNMKNSFCIVIIKCLLCTIQIPSYDHHEKFYTQTDNIAMELFFGSALSNFCIVHLENKFVTILSDVLMVF